MKKDFQDRIDEYIFGRMSDEDKAQFEAEINQDESKKKRLEFTRNVSRAITSREDKLARMNTMQGMYDSRHRHSVVFMRAASTDDCQHVSVYSYAKKKVSIRIWWWASGFAAVLVMGLFTLVTFRDNSIFIDFSSDKIFNNNNYSFGIDSIEIDNTIQNNIILQDSTQTIVEDTLEIIKE
mgnify:CR=1 FL=1